MKLTEAAGKIAEQAYKEEAASKQQEASSDTQDDVSKPKDNVVVRLFYLQKELLLACPLIVTNRSKTFTLNISSISCFKTNH